MSELAPAPWSIDSDDDAIGRHWKNSLSIVDAEDGEIAVLMRGYEGDADGGLPSWANACLIAAAPELLEALHAVNRYWHDFQSGNHRDWDSINNKVRAAIAKAEGKTE